MSLLKHITDATFDETLKSEKPVVVYFGAPWCGPCKALGPVMEQAAIEYADKVDICKMNIDEEMEKAAGLGIRNIPITIIFKNGSISERIIGAKTIDEIKNLIDKHL